MTLHPDVARKAQAQIDAVVGRNSVPTFSDKTSLPYIEAVTKELLRWSAIAPLGS